MIMVVLVVMLMMIIINLYTITISKRCEVLIYNTIQYAFLCHSVLVFFRNFLVLNLVQLVTCKL